MTELIVRIDLGPCGRMGPGKLELLQNIERHGSISAAGRAMGMHFHQAWVLVDQLNQAFKEPVVVSQLGGRRGGGAIVTEFGKGIIQHYALIISDARETAGPHLEFINSCLRSEPGDTRYGKTATKRNRKARRLARLAADAGQ